jgi:hypothetical protein
VVLAFLWLAFIAVSVVAVFLTLFTGRYPRGLFDFNVGVLGVRDHCGRQCDLLLADHADTAIAPMNRVIHGCVIRFALAPHVSSSS